MAANGLELANVGFEPTFVARGTQTTIDITLLLNTSIDNWKVTDDVSMSDLCPICFSINSNKLTATEIPNLKKADWDSFRLTTEVGKAAPDTVTEDWIENETNCITTLIQEATKAACPWSNY